MTVSEKQKIDDMVIRLQVILTAPEFGTPEQHTQLEDIADELVLLMN